jgi:hypothetical protein
MFSIKSNSSDRELAFFGIRENHFTVEFRSAELRVIREVYTFTDDHGLAKLFSRLAAHEQPWVGSNDWASLEGEFSISATCSRSGHVIFSVSLWDSPGAAEEWRVSCALTSELGQLPKIAKGMNRLFGIDANI